MLKVKDVSIKLGISIRTIQNLCKSGTIPAYKIGRSYFIDEKELENFVQSTKNYKENIEK